MRLAKAWSVALVGIDVTPVEVEVSVGGGLPSTVIVGCADTAIKEARERCRSAVAASGFSWPPSSVTINLTPADLPKTGTHYDLSIAAAVLAAAGVVPLEAVRSAVFLGELGLDGRVRRVRGVLPALVEGRRTGLIRAVVPAAQLGEAGLVEGVDVAGVSSLIDLVALLRGEPYPQPEPARPRASDPGRVKDLADVVGQHEARHALEVAAAGGHHLSLTGPPGVGKTLLAERLPGLLPDLTIEEALQVSAIHSLAGRSLDGGLIVRPPYADPHHSASRAALVGGGSLVAVPGAVSRAHLGVLFLDEAPEFSSGALEGLRTPLEEGHIVLMRAKAAVTYPARFQLVLASNPCPCGWYNVRDHASKCSCPPQAIRRYTTRLSGPILDRIDLHVTLHPLRSAFLKKLATSPGESSAVVAERVLEARLRQRHRLAEFGYSRNVEVPGPVLRQQLRPAGGLDEVEQAVARGLLSARGVDKVLRVAWTLADLSGRARPAAGDIETALGMRLGESEEVRCA